MHPNTTKHNKTWVFGPMGWIEYVFCDKFRRNFVAWTFALIAPDETRPFCTEFTIVTKHSQRHQNTMKCTKTRCYSPMGWIGCARCEKLRCDFVAWTFTLIAPVQPVLHRVYCRNKTILNAPEHYEMCQNMSLGSYGLDRVCSLRKILTQHRGPHFCINCTRLGHFAPSFMQ